MLPSVKLLSEINRYSDLAPIYGELVDLAHTYGSSFDCTAVNDIVRRVCSVSAYDAREAAQEYRLAYMRLAVIRQELLLRNQKASTLVTQPTDWVDPPSRVLPALFLIDPKAGNNLAMSSAKSELTLLLDHLTILRDDLRQQQRSDWVNTPKRLEPYMNTHYSLLKRRLAHYLVQSNQWSDLRAIELWQHGFTCDKPLAPTTYFTLTFDTFEIVIDFYKGLL